MKLLFITEYFPATSDVDIHGGVEARTYYLLRNLVHRHKVTVIASKEKNKPKTQLLEGIQVIRIGPPRTYAASVGQPLTRLLYISLSLWSGLRLDFDLVEGVGYMGWLPAQILALLKQKKCVLWVPDIVETHFLLIKIQRIALAGKSIIICISNIVKKKLIDYGLEHRRIRVVYCAVDVRYIRTVQVKKPRNPTICTVARLVSYKRVKDLVMATPALIKEFPNLKVEIIGIGEELSQLRRIVAQEKLTKHVYFHGFFSQHHEVLKRIKRATIYCSSSLIEGFGISVVEALAAGVPVVISDIPVHREITKNKGALFFPPKSISGLASQISILLTKKKLYQKLSYEAAQVGKEYETLKMVKKTEKIYENLHSY